MQGCFKIFRWGVSFIITLLLLVIIVVGLPLASLAKVITNPENPKRWLKSGGVYEKAIDVVKDRMPEEMEDEVGEQEFITGEELSEIIPVVFTAEWVEPNAEKAIDAFYVWLEGDSETIDFEVDLSDRKDIAEEEIVGLMRKKVSELPTCDVTTVPGQGEEFNPFGADCVPPGYDVGEVDTRVGEEFEGLEFFPESVDSEEFVKIDYEMASQAKRVYGIAKNLFLYVAAAIVILSLILVIMVPGWDSGFLVSGIVLVVGSALLLVGGSISKGNFDSIFEQQMTRVPSEEVEMVQELVKGPVRTASSAVVSQASQWGMFVLGGGMILVIIGAVWKYIKENKTEPIGRTSDVWGGEGTGVGGE